MKVTLIRQQQKRSDRYSISVDGKYAFSLGELELLNSGLRLNKELSKEELYKLKYTAKLDKAYDRALNYIAIRRRSEWEIRAYLKNKLNHKSPISKGNPWKIVTTSSENKEKNEQVIDITLNKLSFKGYVDDKAFAQAWVENRRLLKSTSKRRLQQELRAKRINDDVIQEVLSEDETDEREVLKELVAKKRQRSRYKDNLKLMQYLSRQGYNYDDIKFVLEETS